MSPFGLNFTLQFSSCFTPCSSIYQQILVAILCNYKYLTCYVVIGLRLKKATPRQARYHFISSKSKEIIMNACLQTFMPYIAQPFGCSMHTHDDSRLHTSVFALKRLCPD